MMKLGSRSSASTLIALALSLGAAACSSPGLKSAQGGSIGSKYDLSNAELTVGSSDNTEELILGKMTVAALTAAGANVEDETGLAGTVANREALTSGEVDMTWQYTGGAWIVHLGHEKPIRDSGEQYEAVAEEDLEKNGIKWLSPASFNNTYALAVRSEAYSRLGVKKISDLPDLIDEAPSKASLCVGNEFSTRKDGLPGLEERYGFEFPDRHITKLDEGVIYSRVDKGKPCNFGEVFATDGRIQSLDLKLLKDDKNFFPIYNAALTVRKEVFQQYPELGKISRAIAQRLDGQTMRKLNAAVDVDGRFPEEVAREWLRQQGLIG